MTDTDLLARIEHALFGCEDGGLLSDAAEVPVGELRRLLREVAPTLVRGPRVWLPGDAVPAGVCVLWPNGVAAMSHEDWTAGAPYVEVFVPDFAAAVAAEQARRAATDGEVTE